MIGIEAQYSPSGTGGQATLSKRRHAFGAFATQRGALEPQHYLYAFREAGVQVNDAALYAALESLPEGAQSQIPLPMFMSLCDIMASKSRLAECFSPHNALTFLHRTSIESGNGSFPARFPVPGLIGGPAVSNNQKTPPVPGGVSESYMYDADPKDAMEGPPLNRWLSAPPTLASDTSASDDSPSKASLSALAEQQGDRRRSSSSFAHQGHLDAITGVVRLVCPSSADSPLRRGAGSMFVASSLDASLSLWSEVGVLVSRIPVASPCTCVASLSNGRICAGTRSSAEIYTLQSGKCSPGSEQTEWSAKQVASVSIASPVTGMYANEVNDRVLVSSRHHGISVYDPTAMKEIQKMGRPVSTEFLSPLGLCIAGCASSSHISAAGYSDGFVCVFDSRCRPEDAHSERGASKSLSSGIMISAASGAINSMAFDACRDLYVASADFSIKSFDFRKPSEPLDMYLGHADSVTSLCLDPTSRYMATGGANGAIRIWGVQDKLTKLTKQRAAGSLSPSNRSMDGSSDAGQSIPETSAVLPEALREWDVADIVQAVGMVDCHKQAVYALCWDRGVLFSGGLDCKLDATSIPYNQLRCL